MRCARSGRAGRGRADRLALMNALETGCKAPDFTAETTQGTLSLSDLLASSKRGVIIYFYPKASTPGCTKQACDFRDSLASLTGSGYSVIGVSADSMAALERFTEKQSLTFPLASDPDHETMDVPTWASSARPSSLTLTVRWLWRSTTSRRRVTWGDCGRLSASTNALAFSVTCKYGS